MAVVSKNIVATYDLNRDGYGESVAELLGKLIPESVYIMDKNGNHMREARIEEVKLDDGSVFYKLVVDFDN